MPIIGFTTIALGYLQSDPFAGSTVTVELMITAVVLILATSSAVAGARLAKRKRLDWRYWALTCFWIGFIGLLILRRKPIARIDCLECRKENSPERTHCWNCNAQLPDAQTAERLAAGEDALLTLFLLNPYEYVKYPPQDLDALKKIFPKYRNAVLNTYVTLQVGRLLSEEIDAASEFLNIKYYR